MLGLVLRFPDNRGALAGRSILRALGASAWLLGLLSLGACALGDREGDGFVTDGREVVVNPSVAPDSGAPTLGGGAATGAPGAGSDPNTSLCTQFPLYQQYVAPLLVKKYAASPEPIACVDCHDGTKTKAALAMLIIRDDAQTTCSIALTLGATKPDLNESEIILASDPSRPDVEHDFKFQTVEEHNVFRDSVLMWLKAERGSP